MHLIDEFQNQEMICSWIVVIYFLLLQQLQNDTVVDVVGVGVDCQMSVVLQLELKLWGRRRRIVTVDWSSWKNWCMMNEWMAVVVD